MYIKEQCNSKATKFQEPHLFTINISIVCIYAKHEQKVASLQSKTDCEPKAAIAVLIDGTILIHLRFVTD